jgi:hypothetical protein
MLTLSIHLLKEIELRVVSYGGSTFPADIDFESSWICNTLTDSTNDTNPILDSTSD